MDPNANAGSNDPVKPPPGGPPPDHTPPAGGADDRPDHRAEVSALKAWFKDNLRGLIFTAISILQWRESGFGSMQPEDSVRSAVPAVLGLVLGNQTILFGLFLSFLRIRVVRPTPEVAVQDVGLEALHARCCPEREGG